MVFMCWPTRLSLGFVWFFFFYFTEKTFHKIKSKCLRCTSIKIFNISNYSIVLLYFNIPLPVCIKRYTWHNPLICFYVIKFPHLTVGPTAWKINWFDNTDTVFFCFFLQGQSTIVSIRSTDRIKVDVLIRLFLHLIWFYSAVCLAIIDHGAWELESNRYLNSCDM